MKQENFKIAWLWLLGPNRLFLKLQWIKALILTIKMTLKIGFGILELNGLIWGGWCTIDSFSFKYVRKFELPERNQVFPQNASIAIQGAFFYNFKVQTMPNILEEFLKNSAVVFKTPTRKVEINCTNLFGVFQLFLMDFFKNSDRYEQLVFKKSHTVLL